MVEKTAPSHEQYVALLEVTESIAVHRSLPDLFHDLTRRLHPVLNFTYLALVVPDPEQNVMRLRTLEASSTGTLKPGMEFPMEDSLSGEVWKNQQLVIVPDTENETRFQRARGTFRAYGVRSAICLPLTTPRRQLGTLTIGTAEANAYGGEDLEIPKRVAAQVAIAVENALNYEDAQVFQQQVIRERDRLKLLLAVNNAVVSNLALSELFRAIPTSVRNAMQCDAACLSLPESDKQHLRVYGLDFPRGRGFLREEMVLSIDGSSPGAAFKTGKSLVFSSAPTSLDEVATKVNEGEGFQSGCFIPIIRQGRILGVLHLLDRRPNAFTQEDVEFLSQVSSQVAIALENALEYRELSESKEKLAEERLYLAREIRTEHGFEEILGRSPALQRVLKQAETVAPTGSTVLVQGETGTGKELVARAIHNLSSRQDNIFVKLNCAAIPLGLLESELFGHERGAFTGAIARKIGRFELAHKGTLFLDEIGDIPPELQPKLLRVLQEQEFERLGSTRSIRVDVRLVAATNRDLAKMVEEREFRADLYYRLNVFPIVIPPLRERREDIPVLVNYFTSKYAQAMNKRIEKVSPQVIEALMRYPWPGNIRELQNFIERAVILSEGNVLQPPLSELRQPIANRTMESGLTLEDAERDHISQALRASGWVIGGPDGAAKRLGIPRTTLIYKMRRLGISREMSEIPVSNAVDA
jgi:formate hydrogenlyase transcriptional activator